MGGYFDRDDEAFRLEVRRFIADKLDPDLAHATRAAANLPRQVVAPWYTALARKGWSAHFWPQAHGGTGWSPIRRFIFESEIAAADAPPLSVFGIYLVGPTLIAFGSPAQQQRYLPGIRSGEELWCQGYSEPNAGSDLAALRTAARRTADGWRLNGQKAWTSAARDADFMICLARTEPDVKRQAGLSLFVVDMRMPGVTVRPVKLLDGHSHVNEVFLDDVALPEDALIGDLNQGWTYGKFLLSHERTNNAQVHRSGSEFRRLRRMAGWPSNRAPPKLDDPAIARRFAEIEVELLALEVSVLRVLSAETAGIEPGPEASIVKLEGSRLQQRISTLALAVLGDVGLSLDGAGQEDGGEAKGWVERHLYRRAATIYAGSNEVQKTIIAKVVLGMGRS